MWTVGRGLLINRRGETLRSHLFIYTQARRWLLSFWNNEFVTLSVDIDNLN